MTVFQLLGIPFCAVMLWLSLSRLRQPGRRAMRLVWAGVWALAGATIAFPDVTFIPARWLGIARGADVVLYVALLVALVFSFALFQRLQRIEADLTVLVREIASLEAKLRE